MKYAHIVAHSPFSYALLFVLAALFLTPSLAHGYVTTSQNAVALSDTAALFTITYAFGSEKNDFYLPVMTTRDLQNGTRSKYLGYTILEEGKRATTTGTSIGLVLSNAKIVDGLYKIPQGSIAYMTLMVLFTTESTNEESDYALKVNELPFFYSNSLTPQHLNPSELEKYVTPEAELNTGNF